MDFYDEIKDLNVKDLEKVVNKRIKKLEKESKKENEGIDTIGYDVGYNPSIYDINDPDTLPPVEVVYIYNGYVPKNMRIVYGITPELFGNSYSNVGCYYYVDDDSYVLDFCKYIQDKDIQNEYEIFGYILEFIKKYFKEIQEIDRYKMFNLIAKEHGGFFDPINEHKFSSFKGKGNAMCSERSLMASNLLNIFGYDTSIAFGSISGLVNGERQEPGYHAFNIIEYTESETNDTITAIIDFSCFIKVFDKNYHVIDTCPFIGEIEVEDDEIAEYVNDSDNTFTFEDYGYMIFGNELFKLGNQSDRHYKIGQGLTYEDFFEKKITK